MDKKLLEKVLSGLSDKNIKFDDLKKTDSKIRF